MSPRHYPPGSAKPDPDEPGPDGAVPQDRPVSPEDTEGHAARFKGADGAEAGPDEAYKIKVRDDPDAPGPDDAVKVRV